VTTAYTWDAEDRLVAVVMGNQRSEFTYDGFSRRVKIVEKLSGVVQSTNKFIWVGGRIAEERNASDVVQKKFYGFGEWRNGVGNLYYARDHLGNLRELTDNSNAVRARYEYDPYGRRTKVSGDLEADWGFTGHYYHAQSGLHLAWFRAYDANLGRWISRDPIMERGGLNLYGYVGGNPINGRDSLGLSDDDDLDERLKYLENGGGIGKATHSYDDDTLAQHNAIMAQAGEDLTEAAKELAIAAAGGLAGKVVIGGAAGAKGVGSYVCKFTDDTWYVGKGPVKRALESAREKMKQGHEIAKIYWDKAKNEIEAFKAEWQKMKKMGGLDDPKTLNKINSPGKKLSGE
jgi:RHS repeat-associated protein